MSRCQSCEGEVETLYECPKCSTPLCIDCRLPSDHECKTPQHTETQSRYKWYHYLIPITLLVLTNPISGNGPYWTLGGITGWFAISYVLMRVASSPNEETTDAG